MVLNGEPVVGYGREGYLSVAVKLYRLKRFH